MALLQRSASSAMYRSSQTVISARASFRCPARAHRARSSQCTTRTFAAAPTSKASMPSRLMMESNATYSNWRASSLTSTQTSVALLFSALVLTVAAEGGIAGLLVLTALVMGYMYPAKVMSFTSIGYRVLQAVATTLPAALGLKTPNAKTQSVTAFKRDSNAAKDLTQLVTAFKSDSNAAKDLTAPENKTRVIKTSAASENNTSVATNLTAFEDRMSPAKAPNVIPTATKGGNLQPELTKANLIVGPTGRTVDLRSYVSEQLAKPASFRGMSINALCVELQPRDLPGRVRPEDFKHRGAITVSTNDPDTFARKIAVQRRWEEQAEGGDLPRLSISSLSEVFACDWTALKLYVATPLDWGVNGPKAVTWGDMRVVAAFGIAAGAVQAPEAEGRGAASTAGMLAEAKAVC